MVFYRDLPQLKIKTEMLVLHKTSTSANDRLAASDFEMVLSFQIGFLLPSVSLHPKVRGKNT